jgi:hypothetical protein
MPKGRSCAARRPVSHTAIFSHPRVSISGSMPTRHHVPVLPEPRSQVRISGDEFLRALHLLPRLVPKGHLFITPSSSCLQPPGVFGLLSSRTLPVTNL